MRTLGQKTGAQRLQGGNFASHAVLGSDKFRRGNLEKEVALLDDLPLGDAKFRDDAAITVLHRLPVAGNRNDTVCHGAGIERDQGGCAQKANEEESGDQPPSSQFGHH
jgi:hypothetical protein